MRKAIDAVIKKLKRWDKPAPTKLLKFTSILGFATGIYVVVAVVTFRQEMIVLGLIAAGLILASATVIWRMWKKRVLAQTGYQVTKHEN